MFCSWDKEKNTAYEWIFHKHCRVQLAYACFFYLFWRSNIFFFIWVLSFYFKSAKVIKLKTLYLSNVKKFYNDLTWPIKFIKHIYIYSQILSYLSIKIDIYNFRIFIQRHFFWGEGENRLYREMKKELFLCMTNSK